MQNLNERQPNETLQSYHARQTAFHRAIKRHGLVIWDSKRLGTYRRAEHGEIGTRNART